MGRERKAVINEELTPALYAQISAVDHSTLRANSGQVSRARRMPREILPSPIQRARCKCSSPSMTFTRYMGASPMGLRPAPLRLPPWVGFFIFSKIKKFCAVGPRIFNGFCFGGLAPKLCRARLNLCWRSSRKSGEFIVTGDSLYTRHNAVIFRKYAVAGAPKSVQRAVKWEVVESCQVFYRCLFFHFLFSLALVATLF